MSVSHRMHEDGKKFIFLVEYVCVCVGGGVGVFVCGEGERQTDRKTGRERQRFGVLFKYFLFLFKGVHLQTFSSKHPRRSSR